MTNTEARAGGNERSVEQQLQRSPSAMPTPGDADGEDECQGSEARQVGHDEAGATLLRHNGLR
ncbi:hypothetical protein QOM21_36850 [Streptomyces sp. Pv4-95]|uniref:hypothetical protein n=1 Tax=Streptomyces sp. Pv4-95 TaxID=3049543 RepID=UPI0038922ED7